MLRVHSTLVESVNSAAIISAEPGIMAVSQEAYFMPEGLPQDSQVASRPGLSMDLRNAGMPCSAQWGQENITKNPPRGLLAHVIS